MEKKISCHQLFSLTVGTSIGGSVLIIPSVTVGISKQDAWIASLLASAFGLGVIWIYYSLGSKYPGMDLIAIIKSILGNWLGSLFLIYLLFSFMLTSSHFLWYVGNFVSTEVMPETPLYAINLLFAAAIIIACFYGLETIARASEIIVFVVWVFFFTAMLLVSPNVNFQNLQPVLERGFIPVVKSTILLSCFITFPVVNILMIYPAHINDIHDAKKSIFCGYLLASSIIFTTIFLSILVLGSSITSESQFPTYLLGKEINLGTIFTRIEFIYGAIWINTQFILAALYFYTCTKGLSCILKLKDHKVIILPLGLIIFIMSMVTFPDSVYQAHWIKYAFLPNIIALGFLLPILLLVIHFIKNSLSKIRNTRINNK